MTGTGPYGGRGVGSIGRWLALLALTTVMFMASGCDDSDGSDPVPPATAAPTATTAPATAVPTPTAVPATVTFTPIPVSTATATPTVNADQGAACRKLAGCGQCFLNQRGECLSADVCAGLLSADEAVCINRVTGCGASALGDCQMSCSGQDEPGQCQ